ncbi:MAG: hypothetical protein WCI84_02030, partial [Bacteroidota bacterium]
MKSFNKIILMTLMFLFMRTVGNAQVTSLWESSSTYGDKGTLYMFGNTAVQYYFVLDTVAKQCKIYNSDNFGVVSTMTLSSSLEY